MAYKNWDDVRDHRIYAYLNQKELDLFLQAMYLKNLSQNATAARQFIVERSQQVVNQNSWIDASQTNIKC